jgi:hypothetical protein
MQGESSMASFRFIMAGLFSALLLVGCAEPPAPSGPLTSGPQVGAPVPGPFYPLNVTGESAGKSSCQFCRNESHPVAMIFARENSPEVAALIKKIDACTVKNSESKMGSFVVFLSDSDKLADDLKEFAKKEKIEKCVLTIDKPAGPRPYKVSKEADVTVVLYTKQMVKANYAFKKGELKDADVEKIVGDVSKILPPAGS